WAFLRCFLPALAMLSACGAAAVVTLAGRFPRRLALAGCSLLVVAAVLNGARQRAALDVFEPQRAMHRFLQTATYVQQALPPDAILFCMEHSGSLRYYTHRTIVRYDYIPERWLDRAVAEVQAMGRPVYFV